MDDLLDLIYAAAADPDGWPAVLERLKARFDAGSAAIVLATDTATTGIAAATGTIADPDVGAAYGLRYAALDPFPPLLAARPIGEVVATRRLWTEEEALRMEFYSDFYRRIGLFDSMGTSLVRDEGRFGVFGIHRLAGQQPFDDADLRDLAALAPHLRRALQLHRQFLNASAGSRALAVLLDRLAVAALCVDAEGRVCYCNRGAEALLARGDGLSLGPGGRLAPHDPMAAQRLDAAIVAAAARTGAGGTLLARRVDGRRPYPILVAPLIPHDPWGAKARVLVLVQDPDAEPGDLAQVSRHFRLTPSESALLDALVRGEKIAEHAAQRAISLNTVRYHLRGLMQKLDARSQADAIRIALKTQGQLSLLRQD